MRVVVLVILALYSFTVIGFTSMEIVHGILHRLPEIHIHHHEHSDHHHFADHHHVQTQEHPSDTTEPILVTNLHHYFEPTANFIFISNNLNSSEYTRLKFFNAVFFVRPPTPPPDLV